jgi:Mg-chelatase subunit ChlD
MKTTVYNLIILDESGSMESIKAQAVSGVNETVQTVLAAQRKHPDQTHYVTLVTFNSTAVKTLYENTPVEQVPRLTDADYIPDCCTPLYDAMGSSLTRLARHAGKDDTVLVTIITDGLENSSREYTHASVKALVDRLTRQEWVFAYIGANQDALEVARSLSVNNAMNFDYSEAGVNSMFTQENACREDFFDEVSQCKSHEELSQARRSCYLKRNIKW